MYSDGFLVHIKEDLLKKNRFSSEQFTLKLDDTHSTNFPSTNKDILKSKEEFFKEIQNLKDSKANLKQLIADARKQAEKKIDSKNDETH